MNKYRRILLTSLIVIGMSSCSSKSEIDGLQRQIEDLKFGRIATIEQQMTNIQSSITTLVATDTQLSSFISTLQLETSALKSDLSSKEKALSDRIVALKKYADDELGKNRDWASVTFATLEQYQSLLTELAGIKQSISSLEINLRTEIESAITASEASMSGWVSEQFSGYYTITQMDAKLKALADSDAAAKQSMSELSEALAEAKTDLATAYTQAIAEAIINHEGTITTKIAADIRTATDALRAQIDALDLRMSAIEGMIQSITVIPAYSDGTLKVSSTGILYISCIISPVSSATGLTKNDIKVLVTSAVTRGSSITTFDVSEILVDGTDGEVEIMSDISSVLPIEAGETILAALNIKAGKADVTSVFTAVAVDDAADLFGASVDLGLSVRWASFNIGASKPEEYGGCYQWAGLEDVASSGINLSWNNCPYHTGLDEHMCWYKYVPSGRDSYWCGSGSPDNKTVLDPEDDIAQVMLGDNWRIPTYMEWEELINNCSWTWTKMKDVNGFKVTSRKSGFTDKWIFLPASGYRWHDGLYYDYSDCYYWSSSLYTDEPYYAFGAEFNSNYIHQVRAIRCLGLFVRPIIPIPSRVSYVLLNESVLVLEAGESTQLTTSVYPETATDKSVFWDSSDNSIATVDSNGTVTAVAVGKAIITVTTNDGSKTASCSVTVRSPLLEVAVDLGLSVYWASCNLGATTPEGYGDYYAWGATEPWYKDGYAQSSSPQWKSGKSGGYSWANCPFNGGYFDCSSSYWSSHKSECVDANNVLLPANDAAHVNLGGNWRMPTIEEWYELLNNCSWTWTSVNGINGYKVQSKKSGYTDKWIFLPAAGSRSDTDLYNVGNEGNYWSSSLYTGDSYFAGFLYFSPSSVDTYGCGRGCGQPVRPVTE